MFYDLMFYFIFFFLLAKFFLKACLRLIQSHAFPDKTIMLHKFYFIEFNDLDSFQHYLISYHVYYKTSIMYIFCR